METPIEEQARMVAETLSARLEPVFVSEPDDASAAIAAKRRQALCFVSQLEDAEVERVAGFCAAYGGRERLWANDAWRERFGQGERR
jgi:hypothetical protein